MERKYRKTKDEKKLNLAATLFLPPEFKTRKWVKTRVAKGHFQICKWVPESQPDPTVIPKDMYEKAQKRQSDIQQVLRNNKKIKSFLRSAQANKMAQIDNFGDIASVADSVPLNDDIENTTVIDTVISNAISGNELLDDDMNLSSNYEDDNETSASNISPLPDDLNH